MKLPRLTIRRLMVAVAVVGVALGLDGMRRRRAEYWSRTAYHVKLYRQRLSLLSGGVRGMHGGREVALPDPIELALVRYHFKLAEKYAQAAQYPWWPVAPDPPEPK
jgi:hypothetical protein